MKCRDPLHLIFLKNKPGTEVLKKGKELYVRATYGTYKLRLIKGKRSKEFRFKLHGKIDHLYLHNGRLRMLPSKTMVNNRLNNTTVVRGITLTASGTANDILEPDTDLLRLTFKEIINIGSPKRMPDKRKLAEKVYRFLANEVVEALAKTHSSS